MDGMSNHEIRMKAWKLYRAHAVSLIVLALGYRTLQAILEFVWKQVLGWNELLLVLVTWLLLSPLSLGAVLCMAHLWRTETEPDYADLMTFYRSAQGWGGAILLYLLQGGAILLPLLVPIAMSMSLTILLFHGSLITIFMILSFIVIVWLLLRIYMAEVLFTSEEDMSAWEAIKDSFFRMSGQVTDLLCMLVAVDIVPIIVSLIVWARQPVGIGVQVAVLVFQVIYVPFAFAAGIGWVVERLNDEEQPEEVVGPPKSPLLRDIANDLGKGGQQPGMEDKS